MDSLSILMKYSAGASQKQTSGSSNSSNTLDVLSRYGKGLSVAPVSQFTGEKQQNDGGFLGGLGYLGEKIGLGFLSSVEGIWDFTAGGLAKLFGADDWAEQQFANDWVNYNHADEWFNPSKGWQVAGDVAGGIGTSLPAILTVAAIGAITVATAGTTLPLWASMLTTGVVAGLGAAGTATKQAYRETGELGGKEFGYGALSGLTEGGVEALSAGIGVGTGAIVKKMSESAARQASKSLLKETGKELLKSFVGEAFEEGLSEFLDPYWKRMTYDPNAKNATLEEIGYAALIGGLSGVVMGGADVAVRSTVNTVRGANLVNNGKAADVIATSENIVADENAVAEYDSFENVKNVLAELKGTMEKTGGEIRTIRQKTLLGYLQQANVYTVFEPTIQKNAAQIIANADRIAERMNAYGYTDASGNPIKIEAAQLREGYDANDRKSFRKVLKNNNLLRTLAVIDTTGQLYMDTKAFEQATLRGEALSSQVDLNRFIETATQEELDSVAERLEIADWQGLTNEQFKEKIVAFSQNGGVETYQAEQTKKAELRAAAEAVSPDKAKKRIPKSFTTKNDGVVRYSQNGVDMAIIKDGDAYRIFDYEKGRLSKTMTLEQLNSELTKIKEGLESELTRLQESQTETEERKQAAEIDAYAAENISAYSKLSDANKSLVRGVIRQARAAGISDTDALSYARVSAKAGVNISFDKHAKVNDSEILIVGENEQTGSPVYADGCYYHETNTIYVNPEAKRSHEALLIHELTHAIYRSKGGAVILMKGVENMSDADKQAIAKKYAGQGSVAIIDEINAHFAEGQLTNKKLLQRLTEDAPTLKQRILAFFNKSAAAYSEDERLTGAAKKLYKQYKKLFDYFAEGKKGRKGYAGNQGNNSFEAPTAKTAPTQRYGRFSYSGNEYEVGESTVESDDKGKYLSINLSSEAQTKYGGLSIRERSNFVKKYIKETFRNVEFTLTDGKTVVITGTDAGKMSNTTFEAKHRTTLELDRLFEIAEYTSSNEQPDHGPFSRFDYYSARVKIGDDVYTCVLNVGAEKTGGSLRLHDVNQFKLLKKEAPTQSNEQTTSASSLESLRSASLDNSISENGENVNPKGKKGVRYALPSDYKPTAADSEYIKALNNGDVEAAQAAVNDAAAKAGYTDRLYHGTKSFGFTVFDSKKSDDGLSFFVTRSKDIARSYANTEKVRPISSKGHLNIEALSETDLVTRLNENADEHDGIKDAYSIFDYNDFKRLNSSLVKRLDNLAERVNTEIADYAERLSTDFNDVDEKTHKYLVKLRDVLNSAEYKNSEFDDISTPLWLLIEQTDAFGDIKGELSQLEKETRIARKYKTLLDRHFEDISSKSLVLQETLGGYSLSFWSVSNARAELANIYGRGIYELLGNSGKQLVIDADSQYWNKIKGWTKAIEPTLDDTVVYKEGDAYYLLRKDTGFVVDSGKLEITDDNRELVSKASDQQLHIFLIAKATNALRILADGKSSTRDIAKWAHNLGYDSVLIKNVNDYGGNGDVSELGDISIYFDSSRLKSADVATYDNDGNVIPLSRRFASTDPDIRYALPETDSNGNELSEAQRSYFKDSKIVSSDGRLLRMYHGTQADFTVFDLSKAGKNGREHGWGFYFTSRKTLAEHYGTPKEVYLDVKKPVYVEKRTMTRGEIKRFISALVDDYVATWEEDWRDSWLSNYVMTYDMSRSAAIDKVTDIIYNANDTDIDLLYEVVIGSGQDSKESIGKLYSVLTKSTGYDGIIKQDGDGGDIIAITFSSEQAKLTTNKNPTTNPDVRYALSDDTDEGSMGGYSRGQRAKFAANNTALKVYSRADAEAVINEIMEERFIFEDDGQYGEISARTRDEVVDYLFRKLNTVKEGYRIPVALNIADYLIEHATIVDMYADGVASEAIQELQVYRSFMHRIDLSGIQKEIEYTFDKRNGINMVWGAPKGKGIAPDTLGMELEEYGIFLKGNNEADLFIQLVERYRKARDLVAEGVKKQTLLDVGSKQKLEDLRQKIARDILIAYDERGAQSKYGKLVEKYTAQIDSLKQQVKNNRRDNAMRNRIIDDAKYLREIAEKRSYVSADVFNAPELTAWLKLLGRLQFRSDLRKTGVRQILLDYGKFYNTENPLLYDADPNLTYIDNNVLDALALIRQNENSTKELSFEELQAAQVIMASAKHLFQNYDQMILEGRKVRISEVAAQGNEILLRSKNHVGRGFFNGIYGVFNKIVEPRVVIKSLENYDPRGILTRAYSEITKGETEAGVLYIRLVENFDTFFAKNKSYKKRLASEYVTVGGKRLTVGQAISLYELSKREQARAGLFEAGFSFMDEKGAKQSVTITQGDIDALSQTFTDTDKQFIAVVEEFFNVRSKQVKTEADLEILGYTNASEDFYFPIKRDSGTIAKNITDARDIMADWANVYNFSFNKDVKKGAANKLFITDVYSVVTRHAQQLSTYAKLTVPLKNFSQIYSRNIGTKTNVITIRNTINERVWGGAENYLRKLFSDIQGKTTSSSFIEKLRGAYAKYQLGANAKVIVSQVTSYPTAAILLDVDCLARGAVMKTNYAAMDEYCGFAKVRNYEKGIVKAEGVIDTVGKLGDLFTKPIQWTDRLTIGKLWNACQVQVQKTNGYKIGTVENMTAAGVLLEEVTRLTQPNYSNSERSELMRSDSDIVRSFTMFTSVPLKQLSRLVESVGEFTALRQMIRSGDTSVEVAERYKVAKRKLGRTIAAITVANMFYVLVGQFFKWLFDKDRKDKDGNEISFVKDLLNDFVSTTVGMLPIVRDIYNFFANDYEFNNFAYETVNNVLTASKELFEMASKAASGEDMSKSDFGKPLRDSLYAIGQITGLPFRNINNQISGLVKHFNPSAAYKYNSMFYNAQYSKDIKKALEKGDTELANTIMSMLLNESRTGDLNDAARGKLTELYGKGYTVLPRTVGNSITYNGETVPMTEQQRKQFVSICSQANGYIEKMVASPRFEKLPEDRQAKAIKSVYDAYYYQAVSDLLGTDANNTLGDLSQYIALDKLAIAFSELSEITSDVDKNGNVINGSKKKKTIAYLLKQNLTDGERLLILYYRGYTILDGDFKGYTKKRARTVLLKYILGLKATAAQKAQIASECGFTVKNGKIVRSSV